MNKKETKTQGNSLLIVENTPIERVHNSFAISQHLYIYRDRGLFKRRIEKTLSDRKKKEIFLECQKKCLYLQPITFKHYNYLLKNLT